MQLSILAEAFEHSIAPPKKRYPDTRQFCISPIHSIDFDIDIRGTKSATMTTIDLEHANDVEAIKALIQAFFDAINAADAQALQSHFFPSANLTILRQDPPRDPLPLGTATTTTTSPSASAGKETLTTVVRTTIETFVKLIEDGQRRRPPGGPVLLEKPDLEATDVKVDALFGTAWSPFTVTFDGVLHHYGTMAYTVGKNEHNQWKIENLTQNYRRTTGWDEVGESARL